MSTSYCCLVAVAFVAVATFVAVAVVSHLRCGRRGDAISQSPQVLRHRFKHDHMSLHHQKLTYQRRRLAHSQKRLLSVILTRHTATQGDKYLILKSDSPGRDADGLRRLRQLQACEEAQDRREHGDGK